MKCTNLESRRILSTKLNFLIEAEKAKMKLKTEKGKEIQYEHKKAYKITLEERLCFPKAKAVGYFKALQ